MGLLLSLYLLTVTLFGAIEFWFAMVKIIAIVSMVGFFAPVALVMLLQTIFSDEIAYLILIVIGLGFTATEPYWMRNIYRRMMLRRYDNLEGFHATR